MTSENGALPIALSTKLANESDLIYEQQRFYSKDEAREVQGNFVPECKIFSGVLLRQQAFAWKYWRLCK